jgi:hypothetical protein
MIFDERRARTQPGSPLAGYPAQVRRLVFWYDALSDWQRLKYAVAAILFLLACGGYLLGLGSTMLLQRVEFESAVLAAEPPPMPTSTAEPIVVAAPAPPTATAIPSPTNVPPTQTPFSAPQITEPRAVPRNLPAAPVPVAPAAPARLTPTPDVIKPRNLETSKPEPPAASVLTPTPGAVRTQVPPPTAVRQTTTPGTPAAKATTVGTPLPTLALPATSGTNGATAVGTRPPTTPTAAKTPVR